VIEGAHRSGSLITARMAAEQGREVFAVRGSPLDPRAAGTNDLIKQGAAVVTKPPTSSAPSSDPGAADRTNRCAAGYGDPLEGDPEPATRAHHQPARPEPGPDRRFDPAECVHRPAIVRTVLLELELAGRRQRQRGGLVSDDLGSFRAVLPSEASPRVLDLVFDGSRPWPSSRTGPCNPRRDR